jgi:hypothetical protein
MSLSKSLSNLSILWDEGWASDTFGERLRYRPQLKTKLSQYYPVY